MKRSSFAALMERRYLRRLLTIPLAWIGVTVAVGLAPLTLLVAAIVDHARPWQRVRLVLLVTGALVIEVAGMLGALVLWVASGFGLIRPATWIWPAYRWLMGTYTATLLAWISRVLGTRVEWRTDATPTTGPVVVLARHTSFFDALIPAVVLCRQRQLISHHVLAAGLRYGPCLDLVGHRFPNRFIARSPREGSDELHEIERLGGYITDRSAGVIFPEGTFRSPTRFERAIERLNASDPVLAERASALEHVLPPRPHGTQAMLRGAPDAQIVVCANTGLEPFATIAEIRANLVSERPVIVETWAVPRETLPQDLDDADAFNEWLLGIYEDIDQWVNANS